MADYRTPEYCSKLYCNYTIFKFCESGELKDREYCYHQPPLDMSLKIVCMLICKLLYYMIYVGPQETPQMCRAGCIPVWYTNNFTTIDFTIYTRLFLVKLKSIVDRPILQNKSIVDTAKQKFVFLVKYNGKIISISYRNMYERT